MKMSRSEKSLRNLDKNNRAAVLIAKNLLKRAEVKVGQSYLDVGCGNEGAAALIARELHLRTIGVDTDTDLIAQAQSQSEEVPNLRFQVGSAENLPFSDEAFDFIFCCKVMHHIPNWRAAVSEMIRVLKPQDHLLISDLRLPYCAAFIKDRLRGKLGAFPMRKHIQAEAVRAGLHQTLLEKRIGDYDIIWQKRYPRAKVTPQT